MNKNNMNELIVCKDEEIRVKKLLKVIFDLCDICGFKIKGKIVLENKKNGKIWS